MSLHVSCLNKPLLGLFIAILACVLPATARAQDESFGIASPTVPDTSVFRLGSLSYLQLSPTGHQSTVNRGTLELTPAPLNHTDPIVLRHYNVNAVNFLFTIGDAEYYVTGNGTYDILRGSTSNAPLYQRMTLDLRVGNATTRQFTSGDVAFISSSVIPTVINIPLHSASSTTTDVMTLRIASSLVPADQITPYIVDAHHSLYKVGCFGNCTCPITETPMGGTFGLVALPRSTTVPTEYALVKLSFNTLASTTTHSMNWTGAGIIQYDACPLTSPEHNQHLRAAIRQRDTNLTGDVRYDSNCVIRVAAPPTIDVAIADHNFDCFNHVFDFVAQPH